MGTIVNSWDELRSVFVQKQGAGFCEKVNAYMERLRWYSDTFEVRTGQSLDTYRRIARGDLATPRKSTVMALCVGLGLDYRMATDLLQSAGYALSPTEKTDTAYDYILLMHPGQGLDICNRELKARGVKPLGEKERKPDRIGKKQLA